jgi:hypothetical protein
VNGAADLLGRRSSWGAADVPRLSAVFDQVAALFDAPGRTPLLEVLRGHVGGDLGFDELSGAPNPFLPSDSAFMQPGNYDQFAAATPHGIAYDALTKYFRQPGLEGLTPQEFGVGTEIATQLGGANRADWRSRQGPRGFAAVLDVAKPVLVIGGAALGGAALSGAFAGGGAAAAGAGGIDAATAAGVIGGAEVSGLSPLVAGAGSSGSSLLGSLRSAWQGAQYAQRAAGLVRTLAGGGSSSSSSPAPARAASAPAAPLPAPAPLFFSRREAMA